MERVLVIDDDVELCELVAEYLEAEDFSVEAVHDGGQGIQRAQEGEHALVILDVMLPVVGGFEVLRRIRAAGSPAAHTPVLMLTARGDDVDRIVGLEIGADDYLPKPFNPRELVARIRAILRRSGHLTGGAAEPEPTEAAMLSTRERLRVGDVELDSSTRTVYRSGEPIELTSAEFDLLAMLLRAAGHVVAREDIAQNVLGRKLMPYDRSIDMHVSNLRKKLGHRVGHTERIVTVRGVGYIYTAVTSDE